MEDAQIIDLFLARSETAISQTAIRYGSEAKEEEDVAFLCWEKDGVSCSIMDPGARVSVNALFSAARELLEK